MRLMWAVLALGLFVGVAAPMAFAADQPGSTHKNESWGFKVRYPNKWTVVNMSTKEQWICAKFIGTRELYGAKGEGWGETPEMWVIGFPHARKDQRGAKREKVTEELTVITIENPYKDYKDFVKREKDLTTEGGFFYSREENDTIDGLPVDLYEIKVEKMVENPRRILAYVFHCEDVDYAVQFKILEHHYDDWKGTIKTCLASLRPIERTKPMPGASTTGRKIVETESEKDMTPEQRKEKRMRDVESYLAAEKDNLPKDWTFTETKRFAVLSHADKKYTKLVLDHAENVYAYLEETFPDLGHEYVPRGIIRIFGSDDERRAFDQGTRSVWFDEVRQILVTKDNSGGLLWEFSSLSGEVCRQWLYYRNRSLSDSMPYWIRWGLENHVEAMRPSKSKGLVFARTADDILGMRKLIEENKAKPIRDIFLLDEREESADGSSVTFTFGSNQTGCVISWLLTKGDAKKLKGSLNRYLKAMVAAIEVEDAKWEEEEAKRRKEMDARIAKGEGGEDEAKKAAEDAWKEYRERLKAKEAAIRKAAFDAAFGTMDDKDWERADKAWRKYAVGK